jgi:hypothetical protein
VFASVDFNLVEEVAFWSRVFGVYSTFLDKLK